MPVFRLVCRSEGCPQVGQERRLLLVRADLLPAWRKEHPCVCGAELTRNIRGPSCNVVERLDNGRLARVVERDPNITELIRERNRTEGNQV